VIETLAAGALAAALGSPLAALLAGGGRWRGGAQIDVGHVGTPYARVQLPTSIDPTADDDFHDLRIFDDRGAEIPYAVDARPPSAAARTIVTHDRTFVFGTGTNATFDLGARRPCEAIALQVQRDRYFTRVAVDAGDDGRTWRTVRDDALLYRAAGSERAESTVAFAPTIARYLRVRVLDGRAAFPLVAIAPESRRTHR
jgi:F5/8 type C domain-containing protein/uncharacterized protein DUF3999